MACGRVARVQRGDQRPEPRRPFQAESWSKCWQPQRSQALGARAGVRPLRDLRPLSSYLTLRAGGLPGTIFEPVQMRPALALSLSSSQNRLVRSHGDRQRRDLGLRPVVGVERWFHPKSRQLRKRKSKKSRRKFHSRLLIGERNQKAGVNFILGPLIIRRRSPAY